MDSAVTNMLRVNIGRALLSLLLILLNGCASMRNTPADTIYQDSLGQVTVIAIEQTPSSNSHLTEVAPQPNGKGDNSLTG